MVGTRVEYEAIKKRILEVLKEKDRKVYISDLIMSVAGSITKAYRVLVALAMLASESKVKIYENKYGVLVSLNEEDENEKAKENVVINKK